MFSTSAAFVSGLGSSLVFTRMKKMKRAMGAAGLAAVGVLFAAGSAGAQYATPNTATVIGGGGTAISTAGTQCPGLPTGVKSLDAGGDGCLAANINFNGDARGGVVVDNRGTVYFGNTLGIVQSINPSSGLLSAAAGGQTAGCTNKLDAVGDGCIATLASATATATAGTHLAAVRGIGIDPYGNVIIPMYGGNLVSMICNTASPLCSAANLGKLMPVAGCSTSPASNGTAAPQGTSVQPALADNVVAYHSSATCSSTTGNGSGEVGAPRGATGDQFGNVFYADTDQSRFRVVLGPLTSSYFTGNNPLYAALQTYYGAGNETAGNVYTLVNFAGNSKTGPSTAATVVGANCSTKSGTTAPTALDVSGDGCPFQFSTLTTPTSGSTLAVAVDAAGNVIYTDQAGLMVHVIYVGGATSGAALVAQNNMIAAIVANNSGVTASGATAPQIGYVYALAGGGAGTISATPAVGTSVALDNQIQKVFLGLNGNLYIGDNARVVIEDLSTGTVRILAASSTNPSSGAFCSGSAGAKAIDALGDGCPAGQFKFGPQNALGVAVDSTGNMYIMDGLNQVIRKVQAVGLAPQTIGTSQVQTYTFHVPETVSGTITTLIGGTTVTPDMTLGTATCGTQNADKSFDCSLPMTILPTTAAGIRGATVGIIGVFSPTAGSPSAFSVAAGATGLVNGSVEVADTVVGASGAVAPTTTTVGSTNPLAVALDGASNVYFVDGSNNIKESIGGTVTAVGTVPAGASQIAVGPGGSVYAVGTGASTITELLVNGPPNSTGTPASFTQTTLSYAPVAGTATPQAVAVDTYGNVFVADKQGTTANTAIIKVTQVANTLDPQQVVATGFTNPTSMAIDRLGNIYVVDTGALYKLAPGYGTTVVGDAALGYTQSTVTFTGTVTPASVAVDAAGNVYVQDTTSHGVVMLTTAGSQVQVLNSGITTPVGIAVDGAGNVFSADSAAAGVKEIVRGAYTIPLGTSTNTASVVLTNVGPTAATGLSQGGNFGDFTVGGTCVSGAIASGASCTLTVQATTCQGAGPSPSVTYSLLPLASTVGSVVVTANKSALASCGASTTVITGPSTAVYAASPATEATYSVTVTAGSGTPTGVVAVSLDGATAVNYILTNGVASVPVVGAQVGSHTLAANYTSQNGFGASTATPLSFTITQASTTVTWTPGATSQQVSAAVGNTVLNASSSSTPGYYMYTATPTGGGSAIVIHAASYLPIGTYTLGVTFQPTDTVNFSGSTASGGTYTVTQATTTAGIGGTQFLVAADGTGNFPNVQNAINVMPSTGGNIYIKPGTYNGFVTVAYPNVSLRGLGGDATAVILTNYAGAFSQPAITNTQTNGNNNTQGDEGSATLVVAKTTAPNGSQPTPNNFFASNLTLVNTWDTDNTILDTVKYTGTVPCSTGNTPQTHQALFNAGNLCYSQALAIWITADQAVLNNVYTSSLQDTIYNGSQGCGSTCVAARQYWWRGKVTGNVDFIFGDSASVFDHTTIYTAWHGSTAGGTETIEAQNKKFQSGSAGDYLSGDIMNSDVFTSQSSGMTGLYYGRPYGQYSTYIMLNSSVDQVVPAGWALLGFTAGYLDTSTYAEYNSQLVADPATGSPDANGVIYLGTGGTSSIAGPRETTSLNPGTILATNNPKTQLSAAQATFFYPTAWLGTTVPANASYVSPAPNPSTYINTFTANWDPAKALGMQLNAFVGSTLTMTANAGSNVTVLMRPQTPGGGILPTGTWTLFDNASQIATGTLDQAGQATFSSKTLAGGAHSFTWTYGGDANFAGATTAGANALNVTISTGQVATTTSLVVQANNASVIYGTTVNVTATVAATNGQGAGGATGNVTLNVDGTAFQTQALVAGAYTFAVTGLGAGTHTYSASYAGDTNNAASSSTTNPTSVVTKASLVVTATNASRLYGAANPAFGITVTGLQNSDTVGTAFIGSASLTTTAVRTSPAGTYTITAAAGTLALTGAAANNYSAPAFANGTLTVTGGSAQTIYFAKLPNFTHTVTVQLTARSTSGLAITYSVLSGPATVSGKALTVTGAGAVTVQAAQAGNGNYAAATSVQRTFTAQ